MLKDNEHATPGILPVSVISGMGGIGKSTLAAELASSHRDLQERFADGILWATLGQQPDIFSLLSGWLQTLGDNSPPTMLDDAPSRLQSLLRDKSVLMVLDDVWEAEHVEHFQVGGTKGHMLITTREVKIAYSIGAELFELNVMTNEEALSLISKQIGGKSLQGVERDLASELAEEVGYLPLALELLAVQHRDGVSWTELLKGLQTEIVRLESLDYPEIKDTADKEFLKRQSLEASFNLSLQQLPEDIYQRFVWLGILAEDAAITPAAVATLWETDSDSAQNTIRFLRRKSLLLAGEFQNGMQTYRIHDLLHDLAKYLIQASDKPDQSNELHGLGLTMEEAHTMLLKRYQSSTQENPWHTLKDDGYIHNNLVWHFQQAGKKDQIHALLKETEDGKNAWYMNLEKLGHFDGFIADVHFAWKLAEENMDIGLQCRYALTITSLNSLAGNFHPVLLDALVEKDELTPIQGLAYARQVPDLLKKAEIFIKLIPHLPENMRENVLKEALSEASVIRDKSKRNSILTEFTPLIMQLTGFDECMEVIQTIEDEFFRIKAFGMMAPYLTESMLQILLKSIQDNEDEKFRANVFTWLAPSLSEHLLNDLLIAIQAIENLDIRAFALSSAIIYLPESLLQQVLKNNIEIQDKLLWAVEVKQTWPHLPEPYLRECLKNINAIEDELQRITSLTRLAPVIPELFQREFLEFSKRLKYEGYKAAMLTAIVPYMNEPLLREVLKMLQSFESEWDQSRVMAKLTPRMAQLGKSEEAFELAETIKNRKHLSESLVGISPWSSKKLLKKVIHEFQYIDDGWFSIKAMAGLASQLAKLGEPQTVLKNIQVFNVSHIKVELLIEIAPYLSEPLLQKALKIIQEIEDEKLRAQGLTGLASYLSNSLLRDALRTAQAIKSEDIQSETLIELASYLTEPLLQKVLSAAKNIRSERAKSQLLAGLAPYLTEPLLHKSLTFTQAIKWESNREEALIGLLPQLAKYGFFEDALKKAQNIKNKWLYLKALADITSYLPKKLLQKVLTAEQKIEDGKDFLMAGIVSRLAELDDYEDALSMAQKIENKYLKIKEIIKLTPYLPQLVKSELFEEALEIAHSIEDDEQLYATALGDIASYVPKELLLQKVLTAAQKIEDGNTKDVLMASIVGRLSELNYYEEALSMTQIIEDEYFRRDEIIKLTPHLSEELRLKIFKSVQELENEAFQADTLAELAPHLPEHVLTDVLKSAKAIKYEPSQAKVLESIASCLSSSQLLNDVLAATQAIEDQEARTKILNKLAPQLAKISDDNLFSIWQNVLKNFAHMDRKNFLSGIDAFSPVIAKLGGRDAIFETIHAIQDVWDWWS
ncbi:MAG: hypothetical protein GY749_19230 [Desulfobacteraceae bacterium]|nr:hypothetical protein [Desulfobacteraceae bacterium]